MKKVLLGTALMLTVAATPAVAATPNWNEVSISYFDVSDDFDDESGFGISGTKLLNSNFFVTGSYSTFTVNTFDAFGFDIDEDFNFLSLGLGARKAVAGNTDIFGTVSYEYAEYAVSSGFASRTVADNNGYSLTAGVRSMVTPKVELTAAIDYVEFDDESETGFGVEAAYHFTNKFAAGVGFHNSDDVDTISLNATMKF